MVRKGLSANVTPEQRPEGRSQLCRDPIFQEASLPPAGTPTDSSGLCPKHSRPRFLPQLDSPKWLAVSLEGMGLYSVLSSQSLSVCSGGVSASVSLKNLLCSNYWCDFCLLTRLWLISLPSIFVFSLPGGRGGSPCWALHW